MWMIVDNHLQKSCKKVIRHGEEGLKRVATSYNSTIYFGKKLA